jgi:hypothetical protein
MQAVQGMQNSGGAQEEHSAKEYAEMLDISERTFMELISKAKIRKSSKVDGVPKYRMEDVLKYILSRIPKEVNGKTRTLALYINFCLWRAREKGVTTFEVVDSILSEYKKICGIDYPGSTNVLREKIRTILRVRRFRGSVLPIPRPSGYAFVSAKYATLDQKSVGEIMNERIRKRAKATKIIFYYDPETNFFDTPLLHKTPNKAEIDFLHIMPTVSKTLLEVFAKQ